MNRVVEGDCFDSLSEMEDYADLVYMDPPFNSGRDYRGSPGSISEGASFGDRWSSSDWKIDEWSELSPPSRALVDFTDKVHGKGTASYILSMAARLEAVSRVLSPKGSIFVHCDTSASHMLKLLMDSVFGAANFVNDISWRRVDAKTTGNCFGRVHDSILYYRRPGGTWNPQYIYGKEGDGEKEFLRNVVLTAPSGAGGKSETWKGHDPSEYGRTWSIPKTGAYAKWIDENVIPGYAAMEGWRERLDALDDADMIHFSSSGRPYVKRFLSKDLGRGYCDMLTEILPLAGGAAKERSGYPTQKPIKLVEMLILAASDAGDTVLDPFCGSGTTLIAAQRTGRKWIGMEREHASFDALKKRLDRDLGLDRFGYESISSR